MPNDRTGEVIHNGSGGLIAVCRASHGHRADENDHAVMNMCPPRELAVDAGWVWRIELIAGTETQQASKCTAFRLPRRAGHGRHCRAIGFFLGP